MILQVRFLVSRVPIFHERETVKFHNEDHTKLHTVQMSFNFKRLKVSHTAKFL